MKILLTLFLFVFTFQISFGQEKPTARKIDEFGKLNCEDFWARIDSFHNELLSQPTSIGYAVINRNSQNKDDVKLGLLRRNQTFGLLEKRLGNNRFRVVKKDSEDFSIELWVVPLGAEIPFEFDENWKTDFPQFLKPKVYTRTWENGDICPNVSLISFAEMLLNDKNLSGNIVVFTQTKKQFNQSKKEVLDNFAKNYNIPANRFRTFFINDQPFEGIEYWLVPKKKRH